MKSQVVTFILAAAALSALAAPQTVTLSVAGMTCAACPIAVKKALTKVDGVTQAKVSYEKREAIVTFDDSKTNVQKLVEASTNAGYPASLKR
jgi:periplasmic mercuric ion binding protein